MTTQLILLVSWVVMFFVALFLSRKEGGKAAQLEALKKEIKKNAEEQERAKKITDNVNSFDEHTVRNKLHEIANKQK